MKPSYSVEAFVDEVSNTVSYLLLDEASRACALIDTALHFDAKTGRTATTSADRIASRVRDLDATVEWLLETHVHADHLSAAPYLKSVVGGKIAIGARVTEVQKLFRGVFNAEPGFCTGGTQFDLLLEDGQKIKVGMLEVEVMFTPGHTPACVTYVVSRESNGCAFVGDTLFMPDYGTARCDFPGGNARALYQSVKKVLSLPPKTRLFICHDYCPGGRPLQYECSVAQEREENIHLATGVAEDDFVRMRQARDATLPMPALMLPSVQINMRAGHMPEPEDNGVSYIKIPINMSLQHGTSE